MTYEPSKVLSSDGGVFTVSDKSNLDQWRNAKKVIDTVHEPVYSSLLGCVGDPIDGAFDRALELLEELGAGSNVLQEVTKLFNESASESRDNLAHFCEQLAEREIESAADIVSDMSDFDGNCSPSGSDTLEDIYNEGWSDALSCLGGWSVNIDPEGLS